MLKFVKRLQIYNLIYHPQYILELLSVFFFKIYHLENTTTIKKAFRHYYYNKIGAINNKRTTPSTISCNTNN